MAIIPDGKLYIGTSGWSYSNWKPAFYPPELKSADFLSFYAKQFQTTELNSSFYNFPLAKSIDKWLHTTPDNFRFCAKLHRSITHYKKLVDVKEELLKFAGRFEGLKPKLGQILIQLPPSLTFNRETVLVFYDLLMETMPGFSFSLEARNTSWYDEESLELMSDYNIANVIADAGKRFPLSNAVTANDVYIRFHGREKLYASEYDTEALEEYAEAIKIYLEDGLRVWVFFNNTMYGHALNNAITLKELVKM